MADHKGFVRPGSTQYFYFDTFDGGTGASITMTGLATTDIEIYKDGSNTTRASDTGYALLGTDGIDEFGTGVHGFSIDLASDAAADFFTAGSHYTVVVASVTVDAQTVTFVAGSFTIGFPGAVLNTGITSITDQDTFIIDAGPAEADALNGCVVWIQDKASAVQGGFAVVTDYAVTTKTVQLLAGPTFTITAGDSISFFPPTNPQWAGGVAYTATRGLAGTALPAAAADGAGGLPISDAGGLDLDAMNTNINDIETDTNELQADWTNTGRLDTILDELTTNVDAIETDTQDLQTQIGAAGAGLTAVPWNAAWDAEVESEVNDGLVALGLDHLVGAAVIGADVVDNSIVAKIVSASATADWDDFVNTTDALQAIRDKQTDIETDTAEIGAAGAGLTEAGGTGDQLTAVPYNAAWDAQIESEVNDALVAFFGADVATVVNLIWDEAMTETTGAPAVTGSFREALKWMFALSRNKMLQTATTTTLRNDADSADLATSTVSDDATTFTRGEWST